MRIIHIHLPKTAGTSVRTSIAQGYPDLRMSPSRYPWELRKDSNVYDVYSGHFSFDDVKHLAGKRITILRDPIDRFISVYHFWRKLYDKGVEVTRNTKLANKYSLEQFARLFDEPTLIQEFFSRAVWQFANSYELAKRTEYRINSGNTEKELLNQAIQHLDKFAVVGFQDDYHGFLSKIENELGLCLKYTETNVTGGRQCRDVIPQKTLSLIEKWVYLDIELYNMAKERYK